MIANCRSCHAEIVWAYNPDTGRRVPLDAKPVTMYELNEAEEGATPETYTTTVYQNHFVTCPQRDEWRRK